MTRQEWEWGRTYTLSLGIGNNEKRADLAEFSSAHDKMSDMTVKVVNFGKRRVRAKYEAKDPE